MGGTGSVAFLQLAHLGIGRITVIDGDRVEASNVSRILGATADDAGRTWKVDVAARYAERLGIGTEIRCLKRSFGQGCVSSRNRGCDLALSCVDRHLPRALLNRLSYEKAVPLIDMGSAFRVDADGRIAAGAGRVVVVGPGRPCLACWGHIDPAVYASSHCRRPIMRERWPTAISAGLKFRNQAWLRSIRPLPEPPLLSSCVW